MFAFDAAGRLRKANPGAKTWIGAAGDEWHGLDVRQLFVPEMALQAQAQFARALAGENVSTELAFWRHDNQPVEARVKWAPIQSDGRTVGVSLIAEMIMNQQRTEQEPKKHQLLSDLVFDHVQDIISYSSPDRVFRDVTTACKTVLGYEPEEMIGQRTFDFFHPEDVEQLRARYGNDMGQLNSDVFTCRVRHKDGHYVWMETTIQMIRNADGQLGKIIGVGRDITQRQEMLDELRSTKNQLESFMENTVDAIVIFDVHLTVVRVNPAYERMFGYTQEELVGVFVCDQKIVPPDLRADVLRKVERVLQGESILGTESVCLTKSGQLIDVMLSITPIRFNEQEVAGWSVTIRDITEHKRTQDLLLQSEKLSIAGQLAAGVAHEIRNPLTALKGFVQLMKMSGKENELYLDVMSSELNRIELIVSELLVLAKPQVTTFRTKDVTRLLQEVATLLHTQAIMSNIQVVTDFDDDLPWILCDDSQLKQVFINFLKNAIEAMQEGGTIRIEARLADNKQVLLRFIDEGCGISEDLIARIGEPFYTTKEKGTGLGMMVSKKIIKNHGGQMTIHSQVGIGTTIELVIPGVVKAEGHSGE